MQEVPGQETAFRLEEAGIQDVHAALKRGSITCRQLVAGYLDRIAALSSDGPRLNAFISVNPSALEEADLLDEEFSRTGELRPLHGVVVSLKDSIDATGMPTTAGSALLKNSIPKEDAHLVARLRQAGAIILGKNTLGDLSGSSYSTVVGIPRNPYNTRRAPGGSSSGCGVAVAANLTMVAVGEDTMTSVRTPAALTNIVGLRPTTGLISSRGLVPRKVGIDTAGPMARSVTDAALLLNALAAPDQADPQSLATFASFPEHAKVSGQYRDFTTYLKSGALDGVRIGAGRDFFGGDPEIDALAEEAIQAIRRLGAEVVDVRFEERFYATYVQDALQNLTPILMYSFRESFERYLRPLGSGVPKTVEEWLRAYEGELQSSKLPPEQARPSHVLPVLREAVRHSSADPAYQQMIKETLPMLAREKRALFDRNEVAAIVMPYQPMFAEPIVTPLETQIDSAFVSPPAGKIAPNTIGGYGAEGFPMIVVPMGFGSQGLPMGLAIMGRPCTDGEILGYAYAYEQGTRHRRAPDLG